MIETKPIPGRIYGNSGIVHIAKINQGPSPYSMLQDIRRVATLKLVPRICSELATNIDSGRRGLVSEFM